MKGVCRIKFYVSDDDHGHQQLRTWMEGIDKPYTTALLGENDWAHSWQKYYKPMEVGERLYIVPEWEREEPVPAGKTAPLSESRPDLRHRLPRLHPALPLGRGAVCALRGTGCWTWAAAAASSPSRPWPGRLRRGGGGYRPQGGRRGL